MGRHAIVSKRVEGEEFAKLFLSYSLDNDSVRSFVRDVVATEFNSGEWRDINSFYAGIESVSEFANSKNARAFLLYVESILADVETARMESYTEDYSFDVDYSA